MSHYSRAVYWVVLLIISDSQVTISRLIPVRGSPVANSHPHNNIWQNNLCEDETAGSRNFIAKDTNHAKDCFPYLRNCSQHYVKNLSTNFHYTCNEQPWLIPYSSNSSPKYTCDGNTTQLQDQRKPTKLYASKKPSQTNAQHLPSAHTPHTTISRATQARRFVHCRKIATKPQQPSDLRRNVNRPVFSALWPHDVKRRSFIIN